MTRRIIVPLDLSATAEAALPLARRLARQLGAQVTLVAVLEVPASFGHHVQEDATPRRAASAAAAPPPGPTPSSPYGSWTGWSSFEPSAKQIDEVARETTEAERYLTTIGRSFEADHVETVVRFGSPAERILELSETRDNALVVLASHGRSGIGRAIVGSVAARVVQNSRQPVFLVRARDGAQDDQIDKPIESILVPVDGSTLAERAIPTISSLFKHETAHIHLLHVIESPRFAIKSQAEEYTNWLATQISESGTPASAEVTEGRPSDEINGAAARKDVDLIAMSTHGRTGLNRVVLGSVAERVLHNAERPLLLVPARASVE
jgi:nucleotide-binding universal stress UspA family protein